MDLSELCDYIYANRDKIAVRVNIGGQLFIKYLFELPAELAILHTLNFVREWHKSGRIPHHVVKPTVPPPGGFWGEVPPPAQAPVDPVAAGQGLATGLKWERLSGGRSRCACCGCDIPSGGVIVWVPDGVHRTMTEAQVTELCRLNALNGHWSGWCLQCAPRNEENRAKAAK
jgi:hypothetical protein